MEGSAEPNVEASGSGAHAAGCLRPEPGEDRPQGTPTQSRSGLTSAGLYSRTLIVVEDRELLRHFLVSWLATACPEFQTVALPSLNNAEANAAIGSAAMVVLGAGNGLEPDPALEGQIRLIRTIREDIPIALVGDPDMRAAEELIQQFGVAGYIPTTSPSEVAAAALRLIVAGGRYIPYKIGTNLPGRGPADMQDLAAITGEAEALLTPRERAVLQCLRRGLPNKLIAHNLGISIGTAKMHVHNIIAKLKVHNRTEAAVSRAELDRVAEASLIDDSNGCRRSVSSRQTEKPRLPQ